MKENEEDQVARWRKQERTEFIVRLVRRIMGIAFILVALPQMRPENGSGAMFAIAVLSVGCILLAPDIVTWLSGSGGSVLYSHTEGTKAPAYGIPESLVANGKYAEAEEEYEKIIEEYPGEVKPHIDMINIASARLNDLDLAKKIFNRGMGMLVEDDDRNKLLEAYNRIRTLAKPTIEPPRPTVKYISGNAAQKMGEPNQSSEKKA